MIYREVKLLVLEYSGICGENCQFIKYYLSVLGTTLYSTTIGFLYNFMSVTW